MSRFTLAVYGDPDTTFEAPEVDLWAPEEDYALAGEDHRRPDELANEERRRVAAGGAQTHREEPSMTNQNVPNGKAELARRAPNVIDPIAIGQTLAASGYFADAREAAQAAVKVMAGAELGFPPIASMTGIYIVKGRVTLSANLMAATIKRSGRYDYRVQKHTEQECVIDFLEAGEIIGTSGFSMGDAEAAGLAGSDTWKKHPRNMLFARALSNGAKWHCPDVFGGPIYTPDELGEAVDGETGEPTSPPPVSVATIAAPVPAPRIPEEYAQEIAGLAHKIVDRQIWSPEELRARLFAAGADPNAQAAGPAIRSLEPADADGLKEAMVEALADDSADQALASDASGEGA